MGEKQSKVHFQRRNNKAPFPATHVQCSPVLLLGTLLKPAEFQLSSGPICCLGNSDEYIGKCSIHPFMFAFWHLLKMEQRPFFSFFEKIFLTVQQVHIEVSPFYHWQSYERRLRKKTSKKCIPWFWLLSLLVSKMCFSIIKVAAA